MTKERVQQVLDSCGEEVDLDAFMEKIYLLRRIELGERDIEAGRTVNQAGAKKRLERWLS